MALQETLSRCACVCVCVCRSLSVSVCMYHTNNQLRIKGWWRRLYEHSSVQSFTVQTSPVPVTCCLLPFLPSFLFLLSVFRCRLHLLSTLMSLSLFQLQPPYVPPLLNVFVPQRFDLIVPSLPSRSPPSQPLPLFLSILDYVVHYLRFTCPSVCHVYFFPENLPDNKMPLWYHEIARGPLPSGWHVNSASPPLSTTAFCGPETMTGDTASTSRPVTICK